MENDETNPDGANPIGLRWIWDQHSGTSAWAQRRARFKHSVLLGIRSVGIALLDPVPLDVARERVIWMEYFRASSFWVLGQYEASVRCYERVLVRLREVDNWVVGLLPAKAHQYRAHALLAEKHTDEALVALDEAVGNVQSHIHLSASDPSLHSTFGKAYNELALWNWDEVLAELIGIKMAVCMEEDRLAEGISFWEGVRDELEYTTNQSTHEYVDLAVMCAYFCYEKKGRWDGALDVVDWLNHTRPPTANVPDRFREVYDRSLWCHHQLHRWETLESRSRQTCDELDAVAQPTSYCNALFYLAIALGEQGKKAAALATWDRLLAHAHDLEDCQPYRAQAWMSSAGIYLNYWQASGNDGDLDEALRRARAGVELGSNPYNLACVLALRGAVEEALDIVEGCLEQGQITWAHVHGDGADVVADPDLDSLRGHPRYEALVAQYSVDPGSDGARAAT